MDNSSEGSQPSDAKLSPALPLAVAVELKRSIYSLTRPKLAEIISKEFDEPPYRAQQIFEWLYRKHMVTPELMTNISNKFRPLLSQHFDFELPKIEHVAHSKDGTRKYILKVGNTDLVEAVMIKQTSRVTLSSRMTLCVSSQVGCAIGCKFCHTGTMGLKRHLTVDEIIGQVLVVILDSKQYNEMFSNIVFMGMGEPLHNYDNVTDALRILRDPSGFAMSPRKITISTAGLVPAIKRFAEDDVDASLAVSLNATTDESRSAIMPINNKYPIATLLETLKTYPLRKRELITIEYVMLKGVNDSVADLERLPKLLKGLSAKVNLIPYNFNSGLGFESPDQEVPRIWQRELNNRGVFSTIRYSKGPDIAAACGQLVTESSKKKRVKSISILN